MRSGEIHSRGITPVSSIYQTSNSLYQNPSQHNKYAPKKRDSSNKTEDSGVVRIADGHSVWA
jgi:hypothetical protein